MIAKLKDATSQPAFRGVVKENVVTLAQTFLKDLEIMLEGQTGDPGLKVK